MNQFWKREKKSLVVLVHSAVVQFVRGGGGTGGRMTVGGFIIFIYILKMCIHLKISIAFFQEVLFGLTQKMSF